MGIDTCGPEGSIALAEVTEMGVKLLGQQRLAGGRHSVELMPAIRELLETDGVSVSDLDVIVVVRGPGSFTGVRVGLSTAKGLAQASGAAVIGVSRLQVLAQKAGSQAAVLDAGRGEIYFGGAGDESGETVMRPEEVRGRVGVGEIASCEAGAAQMLAGARLVDEPTAEDALRLAQGRILRRDFDDVAVMDAHYLRRSEAEVAAERRAGDVGR